MKGRTLLKYFLVIFMNRAMMMMKMKMKMMMMMMSMMMMMMTLKHSQKDLTLHLDLRASIRGSYAGLSQTFLTREDDHNGCPSRALHCL